MGCCMAKTSTDEREAFLDNENEERQSTLRHNVVVDWEEDTNVPNEVPSLESRETKINVSVVAASERDRDACPYCDSPMGDCNDIILIHDEVDPSFIQELMEHGWWRTGNVLYRPRQEVVCCPAYTIRLDISRFKFTKSHRKVLRKVNSFLMHGDSRWCPTSNDTGALVEETREGKSEHVNMESIGVGQDVLDVSISSATKLVPNLSGSSQTDQSVVRKKRKKEVKSGMGLDPAKKPCRKAKEIRKERKAGNLGKSGATASTEQPVGRSLAEMMEEQGNLNNPKHKLRIELYPVRPMDPKLEEILEESYDLYDRFQEAIHPGKVRFSEFTQFRWGFCTSCIPNNTDKGKLQGTFHQVYFLDDKLIAVSIIDFLPRYFVSIYLYYDPKVRFLQPGIYTILQELHFMSELRSTMPEMQFYDLGYYTKYSPKVSYKSHFHPAEVLCPTTLKWYDLDSVVDKMLQHECVIFGDPKDRKASKEKRRDAVDNILVRLSEDSNAVRYDSLPTFFKSLFAAKLEALYDQTSPDITDKIIFFFNILQ